MSHPLNLDIQDNKYDMFKKVLAHLETETFIIAQKEKAMFNFLCNPANQADLRNYLEFMDQDLYVDTVLGVAMVKPMDNDSGSNMFASQMFDVCQSAILLVLAKVYEEKFEEGIENISITRGELQDLLDMYNISHYNKNARYWVEDALKRFRRLNLVDYSLGKERGITEETSIVIYDSIRLMICDSNNFEIFKSNLRQYGYFTSDEDESSEIETEDDDEDEDVAYINEEGELIYE